ncbi:DEAD/DEAH box helicase domain protein [Thermobaculum terrenum ATCC BAA-798]|uniref:DEAD/DEAH box helicase domain protein n=1 Tax=Thermobaculum terrenum (strain ATCC BAA-798 / CCMEE 7001 / YNP1) TaxID=525904 RepID=D1CEP3_THET1|nr:DEAD/DEAH box helicase [Thermobaculum terrenum]ACZ41399.1 DEAD/DEAH box helicase domain protein [Thermobaculum terrenum ATCC BAA-798]
MLLSHEHIKSSFESLYPFELDDFQKEAIDAYLKEGSVLVAAPTGTGKTVIAEFGVHDAWLRGHRVMYTTPIKALSNQKYRDFRARYGDDVGLLTGDVIENSHGRILVMTTEVLRNMLLQTPWELEDVACVVFDEVHYLSDPERGTTWEEAIILCPEHIQLICLSATVSNAQEIADWISRVHRPTKLIAHYERAVPLSYYYFIDNTILPAFDKNGKLNKKLLNLGGEARQRFRRRVNLSVQESLESERTEPKPPDIVRVLRDKDMLPAIYFLFSRKDCEIAAELCRSMRLQLVTSKEQRDEIKRVIDLFSQRMLPEDRNLAQVKTVLDLARQGIGFHHAGLLPILKQLVEELFSRGLMKVVFATDTLALGINMPARSVVIGQMSKFDGQGVRPLIPNEFQQMAGRAGRRGIDKIGHVIVPYSSWVSFREAMEIATGELHPVQSAFVLRYNTVLNLWDPPKGDRVLYVLQQSLMQFQTNRQIRELSEEIKQWQVQIDSIDRGCLIGYSDGEELLSEYQELNHTRTAIAKRLEELRREQRALQERLKELPWKKPSREALRKLFRSLVPGTMVHLSQKGWCIYAGRSADGTIHLICDGKVHKLAAYNEIDYLPNPEDRIDLPIEISEDVCSGEIVELDELVWRKLQANIQQLELPDLEALIRRHREQIALSISDQMEALKFDEEQTQAELNDLLERIRNHPCDACEVRKQHQRNIREAARLMQRRAEAELELEERSRESERQIRKVLKGIVSVLHQFGYLEDGYQTEKTDLLANLFDTNGLIICEMIYRGYLDNLSPPDIAEVLSWFAYDRDRQFSNMHILPKHLINLRRQLDDLETRILRAESRAGVQISQGYNPYFFGMMRAWCNGASLSQILDKVDIGEGDLVMTFNKTLDLIRQVRDMLVQADPGSPLLPKLDQATALARRGIIEQSYRLGFSLDDDTKEIAESPLPESTIE